MSAVDLFAGPGGWDVAARDLGLDPLGVEWDDAACATRAAAGLRTVQADVAELDPAEFAPVGGLIASPPCQAWSMAGKRGGDRDKAMVYGAAKALLDGHDLRAELGARCEDPRSMLVVEPLRWALALRPTWIALEQVPPVIELWRFYADALRAEGWSVWAGILSAERFGVPQTRRRAILLAHRDRAVHPPPPTHQEYVPGEQARHEITLEGELLPWVSMAEALGWTGQVGFPRQADDGAATEDGYRERDFRDAEEPAFNLTEKARSWTVVDTGNTRGQGEPQTEGRNRSGDEPAVPLTSRADQLERRLAPTIVTTRRPDEGLLIGRQLPEGEGRNIGGRNWTDGRPATTVNGDPRVSRPGHHDENESGSQQRDAVRVTEQEAAVLQSFPPDYPWQGARSKRFEQIGNAVPPLLARAVLQAVADFPAAAEEAA